MSNHFIFVVCGAKEHIDTLHYSLEYLKKHSKNEIWILTDSTRNETPIIHDKIVDIKTPLDLDHHQASIFLKTGIHKFFPKRNRYCYLDTDIIALSDDVDNIFEQYNSPISFAPDHNRIDQFSPYAVNCGCLEEINSSMNVLNEKLNQIEPYRTSNDERIKSARREWQMKYTEINSNLKSRIYFGLKYIFSRKRFNLSSEIYCDRKRKLWLTKDGTVFMKQLNFFKICREVGLKWSFVQMSPISPKGKKLWGFKCDHLRKAILNKYNISPRSNFQHWNGGVFLFDHDSHDFLDTWHQSTMEIFEDPNWKTRDQGTLIKTVWEFGLQNHPTLNKKWNLIADFHNPFLRWIDKETVQLNVDEYIKPTLVHVFHRFGDKKWDFWDFIESKS